tara:strand:+ start:872 stop:1654 length:783 start_codon:yes stop_codon:yes gene_type:complete
MIHIISPAKSLDFETPAETAISTAYAFKKESAQIMNKLSKESREKLMKLMSISENLADLNFTRNQQWKVPSIKTKEAKQALLAFTGDVYAGMNPGSFSDTDFEYAQSHLRILSGLYGILKPMDLILPYRLEMGTSFSVNGSKNLYDYWGDKITQEVNKALKGHGEKVLINLASNEYFKAVKPKLLDGEIITPEFKDEKNGKLKIISFYAKKARGMMSNYIIKNKIAQVEDLKGFDYEGYHFSNELSKANKLVFTRAENWN